MKTYTEVIELIKSTKSPYGDVKIQCKGNKVVWGIKGFIERVPYWAEEVEKNREISMVKFDKDVVSAFLLYLYTDRLYFVHLPLFRCIELFILFHFLDIKPPSEFKKFHWLYSAETLLGIFPAILKQTNYVKYFIVEQAFARILVTGDKFCCKISERYTISDMYPNTDSEERIASINEFLNYKDLIKCYFKHHDKNNMIKLLERANVFHRFDEIVELCDGKPIIDEIWVKFKPLSDVEVINKGDVSLYTCDNKYINTHRFILDTIGIKYNLIKGKYMAFINTDINTLVNLINAYMTQEVDETGNLYELMSLTETYKLHYISRKIHAIFRRRIKEGNLSFISIKCEDRHQSRLSAMLIIDSLYFAAKSTITLSSEFFDKVKAKSAKTLMFVRIIRDELTYNVEIPREIYDVIYKK